MNIFHYKKTPIAFAPDAISNSINKYTENYSIVNNIIDNKKFDIYHYHNKFINIPKDKKCIIQFHSYPEIVKLKFPGKKLVIAQYHATLPEFRNCEIVRNIINFEESEVYKPNEVRDKIRISYSPSNIITRDGHPADKGYNKTFPILQNISNKYKNVEIDVITDVSLEKCLQRKSLSNIVIDEVVTNSYHRSGLEGLAMGKLTICSLDNKVSDVIRNVTGQSHVPFENIWINDLEKQLQNIINLGIDYIIDKGKQNRNWMNKYWHPSDIVKEYINIYEKL